MLCCPRKYNIFMAEVINGIAIVINQHVKVSLGEGRINYPVYLSGKMKIV
jgi:hypothetical protein